MNHLSLIIKREYLNKVKNKSFLIMTVLSPLIMVALIAVVAYLSQLNNNKKRTISILDTSGQVANIFTSTENTTYNILTDITLEDAVEKVKKNEEYGLLYITDDSSTTEAHNVQTKFFSHDTPSLTLMSDLENKIERHLTDLRLEESGLDIAQINASKARIEIEQESFSGEKTSKIDNVLKLAFGGAAGYFLFMFIIIYGNMIMRSVIEEKTSRIIEIIISSVKPVKLMLGKIIGTSLAGITQFAIWIVLGIITVTIVSSIFGIEMGGQQQEIIQQAAQAQGANVDKEMQMAFNAFYNLPLLNLTIAFVLFFIGGYLLYSSLYAAIGAAVDNETDTQQFMLPILMPLILAVYVGIFTVIEDPHGTVSTVFSFIPLTSPVVMLMRIPFGVPIWQQLVSLLLLVGSFMFAVWLAAKIYRVGILMYGKKPTYKELFKWLKY
jgi:ABC-2 type transport system permease protein